MEKYDYIIVGAGAAGCVLANRLSADPKTRVALIEAGSDRNSRKAIVRIPLGMVTFMAPALSFLGGSTFMQWFETVAEAGLKNRKMALPRGRGTGGSTLVNGQIFIRGQREDFDHWRDLGNENWGFDDLLPHFRDLERFEPLINPRSDDHLPARQERAANPIDAAFHGLCGDVTLAHMRSVNPLTQVFLASAKLAGHRFNPDFNGPTQEGYGFYTFTQKNGERVTAESAFIDPIRHRPNLSILSERRVTKVLFEGTRATGVAWRGADGTGGETRGADVILSAGSFDSPHLLLLSGIGDKSQLDQHGIPLVHHLPGVGANLQDHLDVSLEYRAKTTAPYAASWKAFPRNVVHVLNWVFRKRGVFSSTTAEGGAFISTTRAARPDVQLFFCTGLANTQNAKGFGTHGFIMHVCDLQPKMRGSLSLKSADPTEPPRIQYDALQDEDALKVIRTGVKMAREIIAQDPFAPHLAEELAPGKHVQEDHEIDDFIRDTVSTLFHPVGTCAMGRDEMSVVDPASLRVHGTSGVRVVDASVMPRIVSGNTVAATYAVAEKAAKLILANRARPDR